MPRLACSVFMRCRSISARPPPSSQHAQESFGELKDAMDAKSFNIFMSMVKEKVEGLQPYAQVQNAPSMHAPPSLPPPHPVLNTSTQPQHH